MSDPVTNAEVEDVLSSIRRLVSEDKRPVQTAKVEAKTAAAKQPVDARNDRLVLTPALRVPEPQPETSGLDTPEPESAADVAPSRTEALNTPAARDANADRPAEPQDQGGRSDRIEIDSLVMDDTPVEMPQSSTTNEPAAEVITSQSLFERDDSAEEDDHPFDDPSHDYSTDPYHFDDETDSDGEGDDDYLKRIAAAQRGLPDDIDEEETDASEPVSETAVLIEPIARAAEAISPEDSDALSMAATETSNAAPELSGPDKTTPQADPADTPSSDTPEAANKAAALTAKIAALETAIGQIAETWEPDDAGEGDYAGSEPEAMAWEDEEQDLPQSATASEHLEKSAETDAVMEAEADQSPTEEFFSKRHAVEAAPADNAAAQAHSANSEDLGQPEEVENAPESDTAEAERAGTENTAIPIEERLGYSEEDQLIDEEALRDLVSDIVRQELQGALGERITRNVRKLVRREIHRALAAQDLE